MDILLTRFGRLDTLRVLAERRVRASWETRSNGRSPYENNKIAWDRYTRIMDELICVGAQMRNANKAIA